MPECHIRQMKLDEVKDIYSSIRKDFPYGEYAPYEILYRQLQEGIQEGLIFVEDKRKIGYSICTAGNTNGFVLISLLAVFQEFRGHGIGTGFLKALCTRYEKKEGILVEVERPELAHTPAECDTRNKRICYYEKAGFYLIPDINYVIWGIPMYLMALQLRTPRETINSGIKRIMYEIYQPMIGEKFLNKLQFIE